VGGSSYTGSSKAKWPRKVRAGKKINPKLGLLGVVTDSASGAPYTGASSEDDASGARSEDDASIQRKQVTPPPVRSIGTGVEGTGSYSSEPESAHEEALAGVRATEISLAEARKMPEWRDLSQKDKDIAQLVILSFGRFALPTSLAALAHQNARGQGDALARCLTDQGREDVNGAAFRDCCALLPVGSAAVAVCRREVDEALGTAFANWSAASSRREAAACDQLLAFVLQDKGDDEYGCCRGFPGRREFCVAPTTAGKVFIHAARLGHSLEQLQRRRGPDSSNIRGNSGVRLVLEVARRRDLCGRGAALWWVLTTASPTESEAALRGAECRGCPTCLRPFRPLLV
jgi:hypothetical protein